MKLLTLSLFLFISTLVCGQVTVTENFEDTPLTDVLILMEKKYGIKIAYDPELVARISITETLTDLSIEEAFSTIFSSTELSYDQVKADYYSIRPSNKIWEIAGKVIDEDGIGISYAKVRILGSYKGVYAGESGAFQFIHRSDNMPQVEITSLGFKKLVLSAEELKNNNSIKMAIDVHEFPEIEVEYLTEGITVTEDISSISIRPQKIGSVPGTTEPDIFQLVQNIPGINSSSATVSEIQIRGGTSDQNHLIWDGIPIYHPGHFNGMISSINPNIIDETKLHTGIYDPYFGGKASGLIELSSINYIPKKIEAGVGVNGIQGDAYVKVPINPKIGVLLSGRRSYMDLWRSPTYLRYSDRVYQETEILNTGLYTGEPDFDGQNVEQTDITNRFVYYDINGKVIVKPNKKHLLTVSGLYTTNQLDYSSKLVSGEESLTDYISSSNLGFSVNSTHVWSEKFRSSVLGSFARYQYALSNELRFVEPEEEPLLETVEKSNAVSHYVGKWNNRYAFNDRHHITAGYQFLFNQVSYSLITTDEEDAVNETGELNGFTNTIHANYTFKTRKFLTKIGWRTSHLNTTGKIYLEPRVYGQYRLNEWLRIKSSFGIQNQFISQVDEFEYASLGLSNRIWVMADNDEVPVIRSASGNLGLVAEMKGWYFGLDAYIKELQGIVNFSDSEALSSGFIRGEASVLGLDVLVKKRWKNYRMWISYSWNQIDYRFEDLAGTSFPAPFSQPHTAKWVNTLSWRQFEFSSSFKIASGRPYTPIQGVEEIESEDPEEEIEYELIYGVPNSRRLPLFHQLDLTAYYKFPKNPEKKWRGTIGLSCFNVYNNKNLLSRTYDIEVLEDEETEEVSYETYSVDKFFLFITPNALIRFEF